MKAKVIMLETTNTLKGEGLITSDGKWFIRGNEFGCFVDNDTNVIQHHLYLIDEKAEIKEGDVVYLKSIGKHGQIGKYSYDKEHKTHDITTFGNVHYPFSTKEYFSKIIATTDTLQFTTDYHGEPEIREDKVCYNKSVPKLSEQSIKALISHYNKHGEHVSEVVLQDELDCEDCHHKYDCSQMQCSITYPDYCNSKGTVDIIFPEEKTYSRADIINAFTSGHNKAKSGMTHGDALIQYKQEQKL